MNLSYQWLNEYLPLADHQIEPAELAEKLARTSVEIDDVYSPSTGLSKLVVGYIESCQPHPESDHLKLCQVQISSEEKVQIVCGAPNVTAGKKVIVALPGARVADNQKIRKGKIRGEVSNGMLCALQEIGFSEKVAPKDYEEGIWFMADDAQVGDSVFPYLGMDDTIIATDVTPNRGDMFSVYGNVNDIAAMYDLPVNFSMHTVEESSAEKTTDLLQVEIPDPELAPTYKARVIKNVTIQDSPMWLQIRLWNAGVRPINNVVDVTNYILLKYGQPLHSFDFDKLNQKHLTVRHAQADEHLVTLDGEDRELTSQDLVVADGDHPVALAGTMGGDDSKIDDQTINVVLESAIFDPILVRKQARRLDLHSESSMRFERGINPAMCEQALNEAAYWLQELAGGQATQGIATGSEKVARDVNIDLSLTKTNDVLGTDLSMTDLQQIFKQLQFTTQVMNDDHLEVVVPPRRWDIEIQADLYEEIARIYGYDNLPSTLPATGDTEGGLTAWQKLVREARHVLEGLGLNQAISYSLTTDEKARQFKINPSETAPVQLDYPMSSDHTAARMNIISGLLNDVAYNVARQVENVALYEEGRVFLPQADQARPDEPEHIAMALTGSLTTNSWLDKAQPVDFYTVKGILEQLLTNLAIAGKVSYRANDQRDEMHPGRTADVYLDDQLIGFLGQVHPVTAQAYKIPETYVMELDLSQLETAPRLDHHYEPISKYPTVTRDVALLVDQTVTNAQIVEAIQAKGGQYLVDVQLFDLYEGAHLPAGKKSLAYTLTYQDRQNTLTEDQVNAAFEKVVDHLQTTLAAEIR